jgi:hypothetical protein
MKRHGLYDTLKELNASPYSQSVKTLNTLHVNISDCSHWQLKSKPTALGSNLVTT